MVDIYTLEMHWPLDVSYLYGYNDVWIVDNYYRYDVLDGRYL